MHMHSIDAEQSLGIRWPIVARIVRRWVSNTSLAHILWSGGALWVTTVWSARGWPCADRLIPGRTRARYPAGGGTCRRGGGPFRCDGGSPPDGARPSEAAVESIAPRRRSVVGSGGRRVCWMPYIHLSPFYYDLIRTGGKTSADSVFRY